MKRKDQAQEYKTPISDPLHSTFGSSKIPW